jgi:hypothetical protein
MADKLLFILLEGDDDERFFENVVKPLIQKRYLWRKPWKYSQKPRKHEKTVKFINSINSMKADYIYVRDLNDAPCIIAKKEKITRELDHIVIEDKILVVVKEIESWYLAGLDENAFNQLIPKNMPRIEFMRKILESYNVEIAKERNGSFGYFLNKWGK